MRISFRRFAEQKAKWWRYDLGSLNEISTAIITSLIEQVTGIA